MAWKHYIAGIATTLAVGGFAYWISQVDKIVGEKCICTLESEAGDMSFEKIRVIKEDRKWTFQDTYKIEFLNKKDGVVAYISGLVTEPKPTLEKSLNHISYK